MDMTAKYLNYRPISDKKNENVKKFIELSCLSKR
jgi:hypothetical protein